MKRYNFVLWLAAAFLLAATGCSNNSTGPGNGQKASQKRHFVWNAMNYWYYWQADVPQLADNHSYFGSDQAFENYLSSFANPDSLFQALRYKRGVVDRFSYFLPNYQKFINQTKGKFVGLGFQYGYVELRDRFSIVGYVQYIVPGSPAASTDLKRGDIFTKVDGKNLNIKSYIGALAGQSSHTLTLGKVEGGKIVSTDSTITIQSAHYTKDPIFYHTVIDTDGTEIGYLVYNAFHTNSHIELNKVMGQFKSKGINDLILDLRYNPGGALITSDILGSMISGEGPMNIFAELKYIQKRAARKNLNFPFLDSVFVYNSKGQFERAVRMNKLSIKHVYFLISRQTASASEALINGVKPFMDETLIGDTTIGKNHGEMVLYNEPPPYTVDSLADPDTKFAIVPMRFKITNANHNNYPTGFAPDYEVDEINYLNHLPPLGSLKDPLVRKAISVIIGKAPAVKPQARLAHYELGGKVLHARSNRHTYKYQTYITPATLKKFQKKNP